MNPVTLETGPDITAPPFGRASRLVSRWQPEVLPVGQERDIGFSASVLGGDGHFFESSVPHPRPESVSEAERERREPKPGFCHAEELGQDGVSHFTEPDRKFLRELRIKQVSAALHHQLN
jgi:hypothetical protein